MRNEPIARFGEMTVRILKFSLGFSMRYRIALATIVCLLSCSSYAAPPVKSARAKSAHTVKNKADQTKTDTKDTSLCDSDSPDYLLKQHEVPWHKVDPNRVKNLGYRHPNVAATSITVFGKKLYIYKTLMNIGNRRWYMTACVMTRRWQTVDYDLLCHAASYALHHVATELAIEAYENGNKNAYPLLSDDYGDIRLWSGPKRYYFSLGKGNQFTTFEFRKDGFNFVCTTKK